MIQNPSKELTFIVYNTPRPPRYLKVRKSLIKGIIIMIPVLIISSISTSFLYSMYLKAQVNQLKSQEPKVIKRLSLEKLSLQKSVQSLLKTNAMLTKKLSGGPSVETSVTSLAFFTTPIGIEDLRSKELLKIDKLTVSPSGNKVKLSFDLANNSSTNKKLSGHITVIQYQGNTIQYYPNYELSEKNLRLEFSKGEFFSFSRFRPTIAHFNKLRKSSVRYKIYIFSRSGDLMAYKQAGPFNIE